MIRSHAVLVLALALNAAALGNGANKQLMRDPSDRDGPVYAVSGGDHHRPTAVLQTVARPEPAAVRLQNAAQKPALNGIARRSGGRSIGVLALSRAVLPATNRQPIPLNFELGTASRADSVNAAAFGLSDVMLDVTVGAQQLKSFGMRGNLSERRAASAPLVFLGRIDVMEMEGGDRPVIPTRFALAAKLRDQARSQLVVRHTRQFT